MPRLFAVDIPGNKKLPYALRYLYGVGPTLAARLVEQAELDPDRRAHTLTDEELSRLTQLIVDNNIVVEGDLRRETTSNLKRLQAIQCYRGIRHRRGLPVRGQRTQCNARTRKGKRKTVGVQKKG